MPPLKRPSLHLVYEAMRPVEVCDLRGQSPAETKMFGLECHLVSGFEKSGGDARDRTLSSRRLRVNRNIPRQVKARLEGGFNERLNLNVWQLNVLPWGFAKDSSERHPDVR